MKLKLVLSPGLEGDLLLRILGLLLGIYLAGVAWLFAGHPISKLTVISGFLLGFLLPRLVLKKTFNWKVIGIVLLILICSILISGCFYDFSTDGGAIHGPAIQKFLDGWKPYTDSYSNLAAIEQFKHGGPALGEFWTSVYPKAGWICGAQIVELTGQFEHAKAPNFLGIIMAGLAVYRFLSVRFQQRPKWAIVGAILLGLNPVALYQAPTFLIDGLLASMLTVLLFSIAYHLRNPLSKHALFEVSACVIILVNLKFTGLVYVVTILAIGLFFCLLKQTRLVAMKYAGFCAILLIFSVFICGKSPYADNLVAGRHLFAPLLGNNRVDIMTSVKPMNLINYDRVTQFFISNFSYTGSCNPPEATKMRWPFQFKYIPSSWDDLQSGGFGPLFEESILVACLVALICLINMAIPIGTAGLFLCAAILISGFINPEAWWARYAPQLFLLPPLTFLAALNAKKNTLKILGICGCVLLTLNLLIIGSIAVGSKALVSYHRYATYRSILVFQEKSGKAINVEFGRDQLLKRRFSDVGISFIEVVKTDPVRRHILPGTMTCFWQYAY